MSVSGVITSCQKQTVLTWSPGAPTISTFHFHVALFPSSTLFIRLSGAMTSRIHIARPAAAQSYSSDPHGLSNSRSPSGFRSVNPSEADSFQEKLRAYSAQVEDYIEIYSQPLKPHLPSIGRFLIVVTFLEDAWRIMTQWSDQLWYLQKCVEVLASWRDAVSVMVVLMSFLCLDTENSPGVSLISSLLSMSL